MGDKTVAVLCYTGGSIIDGPNGVEYSRAPCRGITIQSGMNFESLNDTLRNALSFDRGGGDDLEIVYRYSTLMTSGSTRFVSIPVRNDMDFNFMISVAPMPPVPIELYVDKKNVIERIENETQVSAEALTYKTVDCPPVPIELYVGKKNVEERIENGTQVFAEALTCKTVDCPPVVGETNGAVNDVNLESELPFSKFQSIPAGNEYIDTQTLIDDESIKGLEDSREHEPPSPAFTQLDMISINSMSESIDIPRAGPVHLADGLHKRKLFDCKDDLKNAVKTYSIHKHQHFEVIESTKLVWAVRCKKYYDGCKWRLRACCRKRHGLFEITQYCNLHTCVYSEVSRDHDQLDSSLIATEVRQIVKNDPSIKVVELQQIIKDKFGYDVHYWKAWEGKRKAMIHAFGDWDQSYQLLSKWMHILKQTNPGTQIKWRLTRMELTENDIFDGVFWAFGASIEGFKYCRPLIQIDESQLCGKYKGNLIIATSVDSNGHIFPLAFSIVNEESADTWGWFLNHLRNIVTQRDDICLISGRHEGIVSTINDPSSGWSQPRAYHRFCLRHVAGNFNAQFKNKFLKDLVYRAGSEFQVRKYEHYMNELGRANKTCLQFFDNISTEKWAQSHDGGHRYGWMTTNISECINGLLKGGRMLPITGLAQLIFYRCVSYFEMQRSESSVAVTNGDVYTRYALNKIKHWEARALGHQVIMVDPVQEVFEVTTGVDRMSSKGGNKHIVKLNDKTCTCNKWQSFGIPCSHVIACCTYRCIDFQRYIDEHYRLESYSSCYNPKFHPIPHQDYWPDPDFVVVHPNKHLLRERGRPRSSRISNELDLRETTSKQRCRVCKQEGHNKRRCQMQEKGSSALII